MGMDGLIDMHTGGLRVNISGRLQVIMLDILAICNTFTPKIKGIHRVLVTLQ